LVYLLFFIYIQPRLGLAIYALKVKDGKREQNGITAENITPFGCIFDI
jgi:hypothetical protein